MARRLRPDEIVLEPKFVHTHRPGQSQDTTASNGAFSTLTYDTLATTAESVRLSQFPHPPDSLPTTPRNFNPPREFTSSPSRSFGTPTTAYTPQLRLSPLGQTSNSPEPSSPMTSSSGRPPATKGTPYHWHDGVSSIDNIDVAEERMLSTSFITNLLREEQPGFFRHDRDGHPLPDTPTDAMSAISEVTYPPQRRYYASSSSTRASPIPSNLPPSSFSFQQGTNASVFTASTSIDGDSTCPSEGQIRTARISHEPSTLRNVIGTVPAPAYSIDRPHSPFNESSEEKAGIDDGSKVNLADYPLSYTPSLDNATPLYPSDVHARRQSVHSTKSHAPSFMSRLSSMSGHRSVKQAIRKLRPPKPLPPVPILPHVPLSQERERRQQDEAMPLPDLAMRANVLQNMLVHGHHPHQSLSSSPIITGTGGVGGGGLRPQPTVRDASAVLPHLQMDSEQYVRRTFYSNNGLPIPPEDPPTPKRKRRKPLLTKWTAKKKWMVVGLALILIIGLAVGLGVGLSAKSKAGGLPVCSAANITGLACDLDATCTCTSSSSTTCVPLAKGLVDLTPSVNQLFGVNFTNERVGQALWMALGDQPGKNCATQALLVDVAPALKASVAGNRTAWARAALLWHLVQSQDLDSVGALRKFVANTAPWETLGGGDGPVMASTGQFQMTSLGFTFDFAAQTVAQATASFVNDGQPTADQLSRVGQVGRTALDRMYGFATASDIQRRSALSVYWRSVLQQQAVDLPSFISLFAGSPILVPLDVSFQTSTNGPRIGSLLNSSDAATPFPAPLSCYPGLQESELDSIRSLEGPVFGLTSTTVTPETTKFDTSCYPDRPVYGVLDILRLRLPFAESQAGAGRPAVVLRRDVRTRAVFRSGGLLSAFPGTTNSTGLPQANVIDDAALLNPREYGTSKRLQHVILNFLTSIGDVNIAKAVVEYVLANEVVPPRDERLLLALSKLPIVEVAVFGTIGKSDIEFSVAPFALPDTGEFFFGTELGAALRQWSISTMGVPVGWTENTTSPEIVADRSFDDDVFGQVWNAVRTYLQAPNSGVHVDVGNVTRAFEQNNKFVSSLY